MSVAARAMGWSRRMRAAASPFAATGEPSNGRPVCVELFISGVWVDITSYVLTRDGGGKIEISRGQSDEGAQVERSTCAFELNNRDGRFSPRNPTGPYYGLIGRNTPLRVSVPDNGYKNYRFQGEVTKWPQEWDITTTDFWVRVEAYGPLSRLEKGRVPTHSVLYTYVTSGFVPSLRAYWPCEDDVLATKIASLVPTAADMTITGNPELGQSEAFSSSDPLTVMADAKFSGRVSTYSPVTSCQLRFLLLIPEFALDDGQVVASIWMDSLDIETWELYYSLASDGSGQLVLRPLDGDGAALAGGVSAFGDVHNKLLRVSVELSQNGANIDCAVRYVEAETNLTTSATGTLNSKVLAVVTKIEIAPEQVLGSATQGMPFVTVGHVTLQNEITSITDFGYHFDSTSEKAGRRFQRICDERNLSFDYVGDLDDTIAMGAQQKVKPLDLMQACVDVDGGIMYENMTAFGMGYRTRASLLNQDPALQFSYSDSILSEVPVPVEDDRFIRNSVDTTKIPDEDATAHAELTTGALSTVEPPGGVGEYGLQAEVNVQFDRQLGDQAGWRLHHGTVDEARFPEISFNLARQQITPQIRSALLNLRPGDRILLTDPPLTQPPDDVSLMVFGWQKEAIDNFQHTMTLNCAPETPWRVATANDVVYGRADTEGSELVADVTSSATSFNVLTTAGPVWTTDSAELPFDLRVGGEIMTVTAINPNAYDTFTRSVSSGWGTSDSSDAWTTAGGSATDFSVASNEGRHLCSTVNVSRRSVLPASSADFDIVCDVTANALSTGNSQWGGIMARHLDANTLYYARLEFTTANTVLLQLYRRLSGVETSLGSYTTAITHSAGQDVRLRFKGAAADLYTKAWLSSSVEPPGWQVTAIDGSIDSGQIGLRSIVDAANTNVNPVLAYDNFSYTNPQTFTVTRSVNGVVKAHSAGADIRLAYPAILGL